MVCLCGKVGAAEVAVGTVWLRLHPATGARNEELGVGLSFLAPKFWCLASQALLRCLSRGFGKTSVFPKIYDFPRCCAYFVPCGFCVAKSNPCGNLCSRRTGSLSPLKLQVTGLIKNPQEAAALFLAGRTFSHALYVHTGDISNSNAHQIVDLCVLS